MRVFSEMSCVDGTYQNTFPVNLHEMGGRNVRHWIWNPPKTANFSIFWAQNGGYNGRTRQKSLSYTRHEPGRHIRMIYIVSRWYLSGDYVRFIKHPFSHQNFCPIIDRFSYFWPLVKPDELVKNSKNIFCSPSTHLALESQSLGREGFIWNL